MATVSRRLPRRPHLDVPKREARELLKEWRAAKPEALDRIRRRHPKFRAAEDPAISLAAFRLSDAQLVIAREYGFSNWTQLKERVNSNTPAGLVEAAIRADDRDAVVRLLRAYPKLLHVPVWSGNWGPPMSHAANLGRLEIIKAVAELGARDFQHAFDRALLQGKIECAKWLHEHGGKLTPGIVMGSCESLNPAGLRFLSDLKAPFTNEAGDPLAPLALVLETYSRNPVGKHAVLEIFAEGGYELPDTPIMAFHRGHIDRLKAHLRRDPGLIERRFGCCEVYPPELGCAADGRSGMCGTPLDGTTLLHLAIDFDESEIFDLLLAQGADVNARATVDAAGFGGHTPLFNAIVSCACANGRQRDASMTRALLERGASPALRATLRKFLDWTENPGWHEARKVTPAEWGRQFPERSWVNVEGLRLLDES
jgi:ankyrin repeat protein